MDAAGADKIKAVAKALKERPQLKIEVPIAVVPDLDRPALIGREIQRRGEQDPKRAARRQENRSRSEPRLRGTHWIPPPSSRY